MRASRDRLLGSMLSLWAIGCATPLTPGGANVRDADDRAVAQCMFVGDLIASKSSGLLNIEAGIEDARVQLRNQAAERAATHIVWGSVTTGVTQTAAGRAYRCP